MFGGNFAPVGWAFCEGQLLPISENEALFALIGTTYGGDGQNTFALPDLRGRIPIHQGSSFTMGQSGGAEEVTLTVNQLPAHSHSFLASTATAGGVSPANSVIGQSDSITMFRAQQGNASMSPLVETSAGGSQPHSNFQPYLCINFIISLFGIFPSQT
jgi:microcystin-dependent protein